MTLELIKLLLPTSFTWLAGAWIVREELINGHSLGLADDVPQRVVNAGPRAFGHVVVALIVGEEVHVKDIGALQQRRDVPVRVSFNLSGPR